VLGTQLGPLLLSVSFQLANPANLAEVQQDLDFCSVLLYETSDAFTTAT